MCHFFMVYFQCYHLHTADNEMHFAFNDLTAFLRVKIILSLSGVHFILCDPKITCAWSFSKLIVFFMSLSTDSLSSPIVVLSLCGRTEIKIIIEISLISLHLNERNDFFLSE